MKIAISLSGSIRQPHLSLESLKVFAGHDVSVFIHTWKDVENIATESFSKKSVTEPTDDLISQYRPAYCEIESWQDLRERFWTELSDWKAAYSHVLPETNNIGMHGMFYSLARSAHVLNVNNYDAVIRMRFDCLIKSNPLKVSMKEGWSIPAGNDFFGLNDQIAWFVPYRSDKNVSSIDADVYFGLFYKMRQLIAAGCLHGPEALLKANFDRTKTPVHRPHFEFSVH